MYYTEDTEDNKENKENVSNNAYNSKLYDEITDRSSKNEFNILVSEGLYNKDEYKLYIDDKNIYIVDVSINPHSTFDDFWRKQKIYLFYSLQKKGIYQNNEKGILKFLEDIKEYNMTYTDGKTRVSIEQFIQNKYEPTFGQKLSSRLNNEFNSVSHAFQKRLGIKSSQKVPRGGKKSSFTRRKGTRRSIRKGTRRSIRKGTRKSIRKGTKRK